MHGAQFRWFIFTEINRIDRSYESRVENVVVVSIRQTAPHSANSILLPRFLMQRFQRYIHMRLCSPHDAQTASPVLGKHTRSSKMILDTGPRMRTRVLFSPRVIIIILHIWQCVYPQPLPALSGPQSAREAHRCYSTGGGKSSGNARISLDTAGSGRDGEAALQPGILVPKNMPRFCCAAI